MIAVVFPLAPCCTGAEEKIPGWKRKRIALKACYVQDEFRVFYALEGESALSPEQKTDTDKDGVPDKIQNIARQLVVGRRLYLEVFKLRHPFESSRYKDRVKYFDVHVASMPSGSYGSAGDGIVNYVRPTDPKGGYEVLTIDVSKDVSCTNLTPAHELFHEFQNGYTLFKNAWYTEGTARWAEYALRKGVGKAGQLPTTEAKRRHCTNSSTTRVASGMRWLRPVTGRARSVCPKSLRRPSTSVHGNGSFKTCACMASISCERFLRNWTPWTTRYRKKKGLIHWTGEKLARMHQTTMT